MNNEEWQKLRNKAKSIADEEFASEASSIIRLTKEEISAIIDESQVEKEKLSELIDIVNDATKSFQQKAEAVRNINGLAEIAVSLIGKLV
jgi:predicted transcriptional regulator